MSLDHGRPALELGSDCGLLELGCYEGGSLDGVATSTMQPIGILRLRSSALAPSWIRTIRQEIKIALSMLVSNVKDFLDSS